jgi:hypothetical protein
MSGRGHEPSEVAVHEFAQLLAGWVPDSELAALRRTLAGGLPAIAAARALAIVAKYDVPLLAGGVQAAKALAAEPRAFADRQPVVRLPMLPFWFSENDPQGRSEADELDRVIARAAGEREGPVAALWRTWRYPSAEDQGPAFRVYLVQVADVAVAGTIAGELQSAVDAQGEAGVEAIVLGAVLRPYQAQALDGSVLMWSASAPAEDAADRGGPPFKIARVFDFAKPGTGPGFYPGHRVTDAAERDRLLKYLTSGAQVLSTTARTQDIVNPDAGWVVPGSFRTDGEWIWTDTVAYYLEQHGLVPDEELAAHIDARARTGRTTAATDFETTVAAASFLLYPPSEHTRQVAWTAGADG